MLSHLIAHKTETQFLESRASSGFFAEVVELARRHGWVNDCGGGFKDFKGEKRSTETHASKTDPEAKLLKKSTGTAAKLCFTAHAVMENRNGLCVHVQVTQSVGEGCAEPDVASDQLDELTMRGFDPKTVGADKGYHRKQFVSECRDRKIKPHVARIEGRKTPGLDGRTERGKHFKISQRLRKRAESIFGWNKTTGNFSKTRYRGVEKNHHAALFVTAACNLVRMARLLSNAPPTQNAAAA